MTLEQLQAKVRKWDFQHTGDATAKSKYGMIFDQLSYHASTEWRVYLPAQHPDFNNSYMERLATWIGNVSREEDQKLLLEYALYISFFSHDDFTALYQTALNREVIPWLAAQMRITLQPAGGQQFHNQIDSELHQKTWFCPITDSMDINEFHKVNHLQGVGLRPAFASLQMMAEHPTNPNLQTVNDWTRFMANPSRDPKRPKPALTRIVLLEDVVGSATQCIDAVRWAVRNLEKPVLFVPLLLCPNGVKALRDEVRASAGRLTVKPVIELRRSDLLGPERQGTDGWPIAPAMEALAQRVASRVSKKGTFGFRTTGCSLATFSNTPNNTIPLVHRRPHNGRWMPIFPRVNRE